MTFLEHGIHGAVLHSSPFALLGFSPRVQAVAGTTGLVAGAWPDVAGFFVAVRELRKANIKWVNAALGKEPLPNLYASMGISWFGFLGKIKMPMKVEVYHKYHYLWEKRWWSWIPGLRLHVKYVDPKFHAAGSDWFPREWWRMALWDLACIFVVWITWFQ